MWAIDHTFNKIHFPNLLHTGENLYETVAATKKTGHLQSENEAGKYTKKQPPLKKIKFFGEGLT